jgi:hypothetical protein
MWAKVIPVSEKTFRQVYKRDGMKIILKVTLRSFETKSFPVYRDYRFRLIIYKTREKFCHLTFQNTNTSYI